MGLLSGTRFARYVSVGLLSAFIDLLCVYLLLNALVDYRLAVSGGFATALLANYMLHSYYTFEAPQMAWSQASRFGVVVVMNYLLTLALVWILHDGLGQPVLVGKVASLPVIAANGYYWCKLWVFGVSPNDASQA